MLRSRPTLLLVAATAAVAATALTLAPAPARAFQRQAFYLGVGLLSENSLGKITASPDGKASTLGTANYPLLLKYDWALKGDRYLSPSFAYTLIPRKTQGDVADVTTWHLHLPFGMNFGRGRGGGGWDWSFGPGILSRTQKGKGGTVQLNNGSGTSTFGVPGRSVETRTLTLTGGLGYTSHAHRLSCDLITEGLASQRRGLSLFLAYAYNLRD